MTSCTTMVWHGARIAVIVPARDEARLIARMLRRVPAYVDAIYVIDDASRDATAERARGIKDLRVTVIEHATNRGVGAAIVTGYQRAIADGAELLVVMAGDDQMDPADLDALLEPVARQTADYAKGNRFRHPEARRMPRLRRIGGRVLSAATRLATGLRVDDTQCGYTALTADAARSLPLDELWPRFGYPNDLLAMLAARGCRVVDVPVRPVYADESSGLRPWHAVLILGLIARAWWRERQVVIARSTMRSAQRSERSRSKHSSSSAGDKSFVIS
jgi:glycosyltransferase involved in cell wall biosynthesis